MQIVSQEITRNILRRNGWRQVRAEYTADDGRTFERRFSVTPSRKVADVVAEHRASVQRTQTKDDTRRADEEALERAKGKVLDNARERTDADLKNAVGLTDDEIAKLKADS